MFCNKCGNPINQGEQFCGKCGNQVNSVQQVQSAIPLAVQSGFKKSDSKKVIIIAVIAVAVLLIGAIIIGVLFAEGDPVGGADFNYDYYYANDDTIDFVSNGDLYYGRGFMIEAVGYTFDGGVDDTFGDNHYWAYLTNDYGSEIEILVYESLNPESELESEYDNLDDLGEKTNLGGATAYVSVDEFEWEDGTQETMISIVAYSDKYIYYIDCEGEDAWSDYELLKDKFQITD